MPTWSSSSTTEHAWSGRPRPHLDCRHILQALEGLVQRLDERGNSIMDKCLLDADGIELTARLKSLYPVIQVIVISYRSGEAYVQHALAADARAYVVKDDLVRDRIPAVAAAIGGPPVAD